RPPRQAPRAPAPAAREDMAAFDHDLDPLFASGGLTADQAASRAGGASPTVRRRVAELEAAVAQLDAAQVALVPVVSGKASYTRLSHVVSALSIPSAQGVMSFLLPSLDNAYLAEAQLVVPLSDYVLRYPKLIDA